MKFHGTIGFWMGDREITPGVFRPIIVEKPYRGDVHRYIRTFQVSENKQNDNLNVSNQISVLSNLFMQQNWTSIRYVIWNGSKWKVNRVTVDYPRVTLEIGDLYNDEDSVT